MKPVCGRCGGPLPAHAVHAPIVVTDASFPADVLASSKPVLLDCWAAWCGPCRMLAPVLDELAEEAAGRYQVAKLDVDANPGVASQFQISSIPTLLLFKNGQLADRLVGLQPKNAIAAALARL